MGIHPVEAAFYYLAAVSIASAILAVTRRNPVHSVLWVLSLFLHVAAIFLLLGAEFLAAVQVIVYAGAILVFYLFFLMLSDLPAEESRPRFAAHWPLCAAAALGFTALLFYANRLGLAQAGDVVSAGASSQRNLTALGVTLFRQFALPFEILSVVLLAAIVGAVVVARKGSEF